MIAIATWPTCADGVLLWRQWALLLTTTSTLRFQSSNKPYSSDAQLMGLLPNPLSCGWRFAPATVHTSACPNGRDSSSVPKDQEAGGPVTQIIG
jgi:hypothetical protein